jgi:DNA-binding beta-propeller fold protein YncE
LIAQRAWRRRAPPAGRALVVGLAAISFAVALPKDARATTSSAYATNSAGEALFQFGVSAGGLLSPLSPATAPTGLKPHGIAVSPDGRSVYVVSAYFYGAVSEFDVGAGGVLTPKAPPLVPTGHEPEWIAVSPDGMSVYVTNSKDNSVSQYNAGPGGALSAKHSETVPTGAGPFGIAVSPDGRSVYVVDDKANTVSQYDVGAEGALSPKTPATVPTGGSPAGIAVSADGKSVYVANLAEAPTGESISQYDVGPGGALSAKTPATVAAGKRPDRIAVSPDGKSVYVTNDEVTFPAVSQFDVGAGGALTPKSPARMMLFGEPLGIAMSPDGKSAYVANLHGFVNQLEVGPGGLLAEETPAFVMTGALTEPLGVALPPDQGPQAMFYAAPARAGSASAFDGSTSSDADGSIARYDWEWGDGARSPNAGARPTHAYAVAGTYTVRLTVTDDGGCSVALVFTGQTAYCAADPRATAAATIAIGAAPGVALGTPSPAITEASLTNPRFRVASAPTAISARTAPRGTVFRFTLSAAAKLLIVITRPAAGLRHGHSCVPPSLKLRRAHAKRCTRTVTVGTLTRSHEPQGADRVAFSGRIGHRALAPGSYHAVLTAADAGGRSNAVTLAFTVVH